jgi:DNA-binding response OmpR family regulator
MGMKNDTGVQPHIMIVEDDRELAEWMLDYLKAKDYQVSLCHRGDEAVGLIQTSNPDIVILDGMLPGLDGMDVCKALRPAFTNAIIMVTARDEEIDEVLGLEMGADDYLTKPVRARALLTRIRKHLARQASALTLSTTITETSDAQFGQNEQLRFDSLVIDRQAMFASLDGEKIKLSSNEFDVLWLLAQQAGKLVTREALVNQLRGFEYDGFDRSIDLRVSRLRKKLKDDPADPFRIKTVWGKGYLFAKDTW